MLQRVWYKKKKRLNKRENLVKQRQKDPMFRASRFGFLKLSFSRYINRPRFLPVHLGKQSSFYLVLFGSMTNNEVLAADWHVRSIEDVIKHFSTSVETGLSNKEASDRYAQYGYNELSSKGGATWIKVLLRQFIDAMNWIFIALGVVSYVFADYATGSLLVFIAVLNLYLSFSQEYAAEQTLAALRNLSSPMALVLREGQEVSIPSREIVPGDVLLIKEGDSVAADARLVQVSNLEVDEALLTGESVPVSKQLIVLDNAGSLRVTTNKPQNLGILT